MIHKLPRHASIKEMTWRVFRKGGCARWRVVRVWGV